MEDFDRFSKFRSTKTILIIGISSFVGSNLAEFFKKDYRVVGTYFKTPVHIPGVHSIPCDVLKKDEMQFALFTFKPDYTIYCVGLSNILHCHEAPEYADALNTVGLFNIADSCMRYKSQIIYISTAFVFGGENKNYLEMDIPDSLTTYGKTKASAEFYIQKTSLNYLVFRCCQLYGRSFNPKQLTWFEKMQRRITKAEGMPCDDHLSIGYLDVTYLGMIIKLSIEKKAVNRLFQLSSTDTMTSYDFAKIYSDVFVDSKTQIKKTRYKVPIATGTTIAYDGGDIFYKMDIANIEGFLNLQLPSIKESLQYTYKRWGGILEKKGKEQNSSGDIKFI